MDIEVYKIVRKRFALTFLIATTVMIPLIIYFISRSLVIDYGPEDHLSYKIAFSIIQFSQGYFCLPIWIQVFVGLELTNGHAHRVVFAKSRKYYVLSKFYYCLIISTFLTLLATVSFLVLTKAFEVRVESSFYFYFALQFLLAAVSSSAVLLGLVFLVKSQVLTWTIYLGWGTIEVVLYTFFKKAHGIELVGLPLQVMRSIYTKGGEYGFDNYYNPIVEDPSSLVPPILLTLSIVTAIYYFFLKSNLKPLSD